MKFLRERGDINDTGCLVGDRVEAVPATQRVGAADDRQSNERIAQPAAQAQMGPAAAAQGKRSGAGKVGDSLEQTGAEEGADRTKGDDQPTGSYINAPSATIQRGEIGWVEGACSRDYSC